MKPHFALLVTLVTLTVVTLVTASCSRAPTSAPLGIAEGALDEESSEFTSEPDPPRRLTLSVTGVFEETFSGTITNETSEPLACGFHWRAFSSRNSLSGFVLVADALNSGESTEFTEDIRDLGLDLGEHLAPGELILSACLRAGAKCSRESEDHTLHFMPTGDGSTAALGMGRPPLFASPAGEQFARETGLGPDYTADGVTQESSLSVRVVKASDSADFRPVDAPGEEQ